MSWKPPTLADEMDMDPAAKVQCWKCRRVTRADMMVRCPPAIHRGAHVCDACRGTLRRQGLATRAELVERFDPPSQVLDKFRARESQS